MKKIIAVLLAVLMTGVINTFSLEAFAKSAEGEAIVVLKNTTNGNFLKASRASSNYGRNIKMKETYSFTGKNQYDKMSIAVLKSTQYSSAELAKMLKKNSAVKYAFPNAKMKITSLTNDEYAQYQWALENTGQNGGLSDLDVNAESHWEKAASSEKEQIVAVVDTGLDLNNPEFKGKIWENKHGSKLRGKNGFNFVDGTPNPQDDNGHGTHCAGIITAAADNGIGISGINKSNVKIMPVKWLDSEGSGELDDILAAYEYINRAIDLGDNVVAISNSWGGGGDEDSVRTFEEIFNIFGKKGVATLVAAGNENVNLSDDNKDEDEFSFFFDEDTYVLPACCNSKYQLTVAATNERDELAGFSNYSDTLVDIAAPGTDILSTVSYDCFNPTIYSPEKRSEVVDVMQDYNDSVSEGDIGYPEFLEIKNKNDETLSAKMSINSDNEKYFGLSGKSLGISFNAENMESEEMPSCCFELPYTVSDDTKNYNISFLTSSNTALYGNVYDVPFAYDVAANYNKIDDYYVSDLYVYDTDNDWDHTVLNIDVADSYLAGTKRKLVFFLEPENEKGLMAIDDFAVSTPGVDASKFGKYDFYSGTSMATPYVAGAVALLKNVYPDSDIRDILNMIKNTGRISEQLEGFVETKRVLSLDNVEKTPPMIFDVDYNGDGKVVISGSFREIDKVEINGAEVTPVSSSIHEITVADNNYNTRKLKIEVTNKYGSDTLIGTVSKKKRIQPTTEIEGAPADTSGGFMVPAGDNAYYIDAYATVGVLSGNSKTGYVYDESAPQFDLYKIFGVNENEEINVYPSAVAYSNGKLYAVLIQEITTAATGTVIGYETAFACLDLVNATSEKLCDVPEEAVFGSTLGALNGNIYLIGGYYDEEFLNSVYLYDSKSKKLIDTNKPLPKGRAYAQFIQYKDKLYGFYGADESGELPSVLCFDGNKWSSTELNADTDDYVEFNTDSGTVNLYKGNLGYGKNGLFLSGVYIYGMGDTYEFDVTKDALVESDYTVNTDKNGVELIGTTIPGCYIGFEVVSVEQEDSDFSYESINRYHATGNSDISSVINGGGIYGEVQAYKLDLTTSYVRVDNSAVKNAIVNADNFNAVYGNNVTVSVFPNEDYELVSFAVDGVKATGEKTVRASAPVIKVTAVVREITYEWNDDENNTDIQPAQKVTKPGKPKLKAKVKKRRVYLSWKRIKKADGYQLQRYKGKKWKTVKTIKNGKKVKFKTAKFKKKATAKYRIRAYKLVDGKRVYGKWSKVKKVKVK